MAVAKVIEICSESSKSFEDAIQVGVQQANKSLKNIRGAWVKEQKVDVKDGKVVGFRVHLNVTFILE